MDRISNILLIDGTGVHTFSGILFFFQRVSTKTCKKTDKPSQNHDSKTQSSWERNEKGAPRKLVLMKSNGITVYSCKNAKQNQ